MVSLFQLIARAGYAFLDLPARLRARLYQVKLRNYCEAAADTQFAPQTLILNPYGKSGVRIGTKTLFMGEINMVAPEAKIRIGDWCYIGPHAKLWVIESIDIGDRVFVSHGVHVFDNNSHSLSAGERHARFRELQTFGRHQQREAVTSRPVKIEDDVWIGFNCAIMKGVTIGRGAVVAAGSVVVHDVSAYTVVAGNPARAVGESKA